MRRRSARLRPVQDSPCDRAMFVCPANIGKKYNQQKIGSEPQPFAQASKPPNCAARATLSLLTFHCSNNLHFRNIGSCLLHTIFARWIWNINLNQKLYQHRPHTSSLARIVVVVGSRSPSPCLGKQRKQHDSGRTTERPEEDMRRTTDRGQKDEGKKTTRTHQAVSYTHLTLPTKLEV